MIFDGAFEQEGSGGAGAGGGRDTSICARKLYILEGDKSDGCSKNTSLYNVYHLPGIVYCSRIFDVIAS